LDGDDPKNEALKEKYGVTGYPRLVFTDSSGAKLDEIAGAPGRDDFEDRVKRLLGK
jgi:thioredoxin-related protein